MSALKATFVGTGLRPRCPPDPRYPDGKAFDLAGDGPSCVVDLEHPAPSVGQWVIVCEICGYRLIATAASRVDDPKTIRVPCKLVGRA
jgi:hypothetical protein